MLEDDENDDNNWNPDAAQRSATAKSCATSSNATGANEIVNPIDKMWHASRIHHGDIKTGENLTFSPGGEKRNEWQRRLDSGRAEALLEIRNSAIEMADIKRHSRCLVIGADDGLFLWELWRKTPEGFVAGICKTERGKQVLEQYGKTLDMIERPLLAMKLEELVDIDFDFIFFKDAISTKESFDNFSEVLNTLNEKFPNAKIILAQKIFSKPQLLANLLLPIYPHKTKLLEKVSAVEESFFAQQAEYNWDTNDLRTLFTTDRETKVIEKTITEKRHISKDDVERWLSKESRYGSFISVNLENEEFSEFSKMLLEQQSRNEWNWHSRYAFIRN